MSDQTQSKYDTLIHRQSSPLCDVSKLISAYLRINGSTIDLKVLLPSLGIHESIDDIIELLTITVTHDSLNKLGIERALLICDELCAHSIVDNILNLNIRLDRIYEYAIINHASNHPFNFDRVCKMYGNGYYPILRNKQNIISDATLLNIAFSNGLYISNSMLHMELHHISAINNNYLKDITNIHISGRYSITYLNKIIHLTNVNKLQITCANPQSCIADIRDTYTQLAKQLKCIDITNSGDIIDNEHLKLCTNLKELYISNNRCINKCAPQFAGSLRLIYAALNSSMCDDGLLLCTKLKILNAFNNPNIKTCAPFAHSLVMLNADNACGISDYELRSCTRLKILCCKDNTKITTCTPFAKTLRVLDASGSCGIRDDGLKLCTKLTYLNTSNNNKITTCAPFAHSLKIICYCRNGILNSNVKKCIKLSYVWSGYPDPIKDISASSLTTSMYNTLRIPKFIDKRI